MRIFRKSNLLPVDQALIIYFLITTVILIVGSFKGMAGTLPHYFFRILLILAIFSLGYTDRIPFRKNVVYQLFRYFYPLALLIFIYHETGFLNKIFFNFFDPFFARLEMILWHAQPSLTFSEVLPQKWFGELMAMGYFSFYFLVFGLGFYSYFKDRRTGIKIISLVIISFLYYYMIFIFVPVAGPQYYFSTINESAVPEGFFSRLVYVAQEIGETTTGAFPSSHVGISSIVLFLSFRYSRKIFPVILIFCLFLWPATVYVKAHYLVDVIGGFLSAPVIFLAARWTVRKLDSA